MHYHSTAAILNLADSLTIVCTLLASPPPSKTNADIVINMWIKFKFYCLRRFWQEKFSFTLKCEVFIAFRRFYPILSIGESEVTMKGSPTMGFLNFNTLDWLKQTSFCQMFQNYFFMKNYFFMGWTPPPANSIPLLPPMVTALLCKRSIARL